MTVCDDCAPGTAVEQLSGEERSGEQAICPTCGRDLSPAPTAPWHFKLMLVAVVIYLGLRAWQGIVWVAGRF